MAGSYDLFKPKRRIYINNIFLNKKYIINIDSLNFDVEMLSISTRY